VLGGTQVPIQRVTLFDYGAVTRSGTPSQTFRLNVTIGNSVRLLPRRRLVLEPRIHQAGRLHVYIGLG
jgi:hypothetical protein